MEWDKPEETSEVLDGPDQDYQLFAVKSAPEAAIILEPKVNGVWILAHLQFWLGQSCQGYFFQSINLLQNALQFPKKDCALDLSKAFQ